MKRTAMELAALASAAMPGLDIVQAATSPDDPRAFDSAIVTDTDNNHWRVRSPHNSQAAFRLETEIQVLSGFTPAIRAHLPFRVPSVAGAVQIDSLRTFVYHQMPGMPVELDAITEAEPQTIDDLGRIIAAIHTLPRAVVETADLPSYGSEQLRSRLLSELDQIALTGKVPSVLLRRWENAFEERQMWTFTPRVVHGDFDETSLLIDRNRAVGVTAWTDLHIGDPAQDFTWLASTDSIEFRDALISAYHRHMDLPADYVDLHIMRRAALAAEFSLAKYLISGINASNNEVVAEAQSMLDDLASDIDATGGQDIGQRFWEPEPTPEPVPEPASEPEVDVDEAEPETDVDDHADPVDPAFDDPVSAGPDAGDAEETATEDARDELSDESSESNEAITDDPDDHTPMAAETEDSTELRVHTLSDDGDLVPHDEAEAPPEDDDTQPISWKTVRENLDNN